MMDFLSALVQEIINLPKMPLQKTALELLSFLHKSELQELYPNLWIALRIAVTLPVTVASAERSFSKLKLMKTYLRSSMAQERLSGLAIISINAQLAQQLSYDDLVDDFASRKCRRISDVQSGEAGEAEPHLSYSNVTEKQLKKNEIVIIIKCLH